MSLKEYHRHVVMIITVDGKSFLGCISDYFFPDDNEDNLESIVMTTSSGMIEFKANDIETIQII